MCEAFASASGILPGLALEPDRKPRSGLRAPASRLAVFPHWTHVPGTPLGGGLASRAGMTGNARTFTATVIAGNPAPEGSPAGTVQLELDGAPVTLNANSQAQWAPSSLRPGSHTITGEYLGYLWPSSGSYMNGAPAATDPRTPRLLRSRQPRCRRPRSPSSLATAPFALERLE